MTVEREALRAVIDAADHAYGRSWREWQGLDGAAGLARALMAAEALVGDPPDVDLWHRPRPGPLYWRFRCTVCSRNVSDHPPWWRRLQRRLTWATR